MKSRLTLALAIGVVATLVSPWAVHAQQTQLVYSIPQARAYAAKFSVHNQVVENVPKCKYDPEHPQNDTPDHADYKYKCDKNRYVQTPNCPASLAIGPEVVPAIVPPQGSAIAGQAGSIPDSEHNVPQSNPVRLNEIVVDGRIGHLGAVLEAGGIASKRFADLDGRQAGGEAHTETDAFSAGKNPYEERCWPVDAQQAFTGSASSYVHVLSRSGSIQTFHFAECVADRCRFVNDASPRAADKATTVVSLQEEGGKLFGKLSSTIDGFTFQQGAFTAEGIATYVEFSSDGTKDGLNWKVVSHVSGARIAGVPTALPAGAAPVPVCPPAPPPDSPPVPGACFAVGMAAPYVKSTDDGKQLTIIAPGLVIAHDQQTAYYGGGELFASFGREAPLPTGSDFIPKIETLGGGFSFIPGTGSAQPFLEAPAPPPGRPGERTIAISQSDASPWPATSILIFGGAAFLLVFAGWLQRFGWGMRLYRVQPFRFFFWIYRAFVRT